MAYLELFERVAAHVRGLGSEVMLDRGKPVSESTIRKAQAEAIIPIPDSVAEFYAEVGNGLEFYYWKDEKNRGPMASYEFPAIEDITLKSIDRVKWRMEWNDSCEFQSTKDSALAKQTAVRMRQWLPIGHEGNGDRYCIDTNADGPPVVFDRHDWFDGGTGDNGHRMGDSLLDFFTDWSKVCFQLPRSLYWLTVFVPGGGIDWKSDEFDRSLCLPD